MVSDVDGVRPVNSAVCAMQIFQKEMEGVAEKAGIKGEEDVVSLLSELRREEEGDSGDQAGGQAKCYLKQPIVHSHQKCYY